MSPKDHSGKGSKDHLAKISKDQSGMVPKAHSGMADPALLTKIDKLFACNVGSYIALPQLVVVGDQSSGKSSVLEGLTGLPFPRDSGLCTRFATQITFRRSPQKHITVAIIPAQDASAEHAASVTGWGKQELQDLDAETFAKIMIEVQQVMGVTDGISNTGTFSEDVLKLELSGPDHEHLSVVGVPGIFKRTTEGLTTKSDIQMVRRMVLSYMENPRCVMLTVIPANVDIATQEILEMADEVDPEGIRTLGILTKPDLVDKGAEGHVTDLVEGKRHALSLGWHVVRNPGQSELGGGVVGREHAEMHFFRSAAPWSGLEKGKIGVASLRVRLQEILGNHVKREFPKVRAELNRKLKDCRKQLDALGASRDSSARQSRYLLEIATRFQELIAQALSTEYAGSEVFEKFPSLKVATLIRNRNESFAATFLEFGHAHAFQSPVATTLEQNETSASDDVKTLSVRQLDDSQAFDLEDILYEHMSILHPQQHTILTWLKQLYHDSRGFELGTFQASILANSMKTQTADWEHLALGYISDIICMTQKAITDLLQYVCPDKRVREALTVVLAEPLMDRYKAAVDHVKFLLQVERAELPMTVNNFFSTSLQHIRQKRQKRATATKTGSQETDAPTEDQTILEVHDILESYYHIARSRFVDCVCMQAAGHYLVTGRETPLKLLNASFVGDLTPEQLEEIAGEDPATLRKRNQLAKEVDDLEAGKKILH